MGVANECKACGIPVVILQMQPFEDEHVMSKNGERYITTRVRQLSHRWNIKKKLIL